MVERKASWENPEGLCLMLISDWQVFVWGAAEIHSQQDECGEPGHSDGDQPAQTSDRRPHHCHERWGTTMWAHICPAWPQNAFIWILLPCFLQRLLWSRSWWPSWSVSTRPCFRHPKTRFSLPRPTRPRTRRTLHEALLAGSLRR